MAAVRGAVRKGERRKREEEEEEWKEKGWREVEKEVNLFPREFLDPRGALSRELSRDARSQRSSHHNARRLTGGPRVSKSSETRKRERETENRRKAESISESEKNDVPSSKERTKDSTTGRNETTRDKEGQTRMERL